MEPFVLQLTQVNFDADDTIEYEKQSHDIDSFSNVVHYDSQLVKSDVSELNFDDDDSQLPQNEKENENGLHLDDSTTDAIYHHPQSPTLINAHSKFINNSGKKMEKQHSDHHVEVKSPGIEGNSFSAFTSTTDALALRNSVIDNPNIVPATNDAIAQAIAAAQAKIQAKQPDDENSSHHTSELIETPPKHHNKETPPEHHNKNEKVNLTEEHQSAILSDSANIEYEGTHTNARGQSNVINMDKEITSIKTEEHKVTQNEQCDTKNLQCDTQRSHRDTPNSHGDDPLTLKANTLEHTNEMNSIPSDNFDKDGNILKGTTPMTLYPQNKGNAPKSKYDTMQSYDLIRVRPEEIITTTEKAPWFPGRAPTEVHKSNEKKNKSSSKRRKTKARRDSNESNASVNSSIAVSDSDTSVVSESKSNLEIDAISASSAKNHVDVVKSDIVVNDALSAGEPIKTLTQNQHVVTQSASNQHVVTQSASNQHVVTQSASNQHVVTQSTSDQHVVTQSASNHHAVTQSASNQHVVTHSASDQHVSHEHINAVTKMSSNVKTTTSIQNTSYQVENTSYMAENTSSIHSLDITDSMVIPEGQNVLVLKHSPPVRDTDSQVRENGPETHDAKSAIHGNIPGEAKELNIETGNQDLANESYQNHPPLSTSTPMRPVPHQRYTEHNAAFENITTSKQTIEHKEKTVKYNIQHEHVFEGLDSGVKMETPNPAPVFKSETPTSMFDDDELDKVLREKAKLEGQLEMLEIEARAAIRDRAELQTQLAALQTQLKSRASYDNMKGDHDLQSELDTMRKTRTNLELAIMDAHKVIGDKMEEIKTAQEEVQIAQNANDKLNDKIRELRDETKSKDSTMQDLKSKIAELYVEVQTSNQARTQSENENRSMKSDLDSLMKSKEWYLAQLQFTQEARSQLQGDITSVQVTSVSQSNQIERLKTENSELQQELAEVQQKAISEKEALARHLEAIEADMMEREAGFKEMQYNQVMSEQALKRKMLAMEEERTKLSHVNERILELEHDLQKAKNELRQKEATISVFEHEQAELMKRLTLSSENITQREHSLDSLEQRTIDFELKIKTLQKDLNIRDEEVMILKQEKSTIAMMLASAQEEKKTFDEALHTLKEDMLKVEQSFKQMRQDLNERNEELNMVKHERDQLQHVLDNTKVEVEQKVKSYESQNVEFSEKSKALDELRIGKVNLEGEIGKLKIDLEVAKTAQDSLTRENTSLEKELTLFKTKCEDSESTLNVTLAEKARLEGQIEMLTSEQEKLRVMAEENEVLRSKVGNLETVSHKDVALKKAKILKLGAEIKSITKESKEKCQEYELKLANLDGKLSVAMETKSQNEAEIAQLKKRLESESDEKVQHFNQKLQTTESELETTMIQKQTLEHKIHEIEIRTLREIEEYRIKVKTLEKQMVTTRESEKQKLTEKMKKKMALELEREKGRLAGVMQSHSALKQHTSLLEQALAKREGTLVELDSVAQSEMRDKNKLESLYRGRITELESILEKERMSSKDTQKQLMVQRGNNTKYRKEVESLKLDVEQLNKDLESYKSQQELQQSEKVKDSQVELQYKTESERLNRELQAMKIEIDRLRYEISEGETRNPLMQQQLQQLEWQVKQKGEEHMALKKQVRLMEKRQQVELKNMKKTVEARNKEIEHLRHELAVSRKEKFDYQSKLAELRGTLKAHKAQPRDVTGGSLGLPEVAPLDTEAIEKLLSDTEKQKVDISKPLNVLQTCLTSLRSEISSLQQHVEGHTIAVQSSTHSWNQVEDHVKELRTISTPSDDSARSRSASPFDDVTMEPQTSEDNAISVSSNNEGSSQLEQPADNTM